MGEKADSELVRRQNRRIVLESLRRHGPLARIDLGRTTGLSPASITSISAQLIEDNAILELDDRISFFPHARRGRPVVRLALKPSATHVLAVRISADLVQLVLADFGGNQLKSKMLAIPTFDAAQDEFGKAIAGEIQIFLRENKLQKGELARIGIAVQGLADSRKGVIPWSPIFHARNIPVAEPVEAATGISCILANDANMMAEGIAARDADSPGRVTAVIFTGGGVGMGLILDGKVFYGSTGAASEFGHVNHIPYGALCRCGRKGCVEAYAADYGIVRMAEGGGDADLKTVQPERMTELLARAQAGDKAVVAAFAKAGEALGFGISRLIAIINPDRIIVAGPSLPAAEFTEKAMHQAINDGVVEELRRHVSIEYTSFNTDTIVSGTITALLQTVDRDVFAAGPIRQAVPLQVAE